MCPFPILPKEDQNCDHMCVLLLGFDNLEHINIWTYHEMFFVLRFLQLRQLMSGRILYC